ncbi:MAG: HAMP domain-containing sensor histidine kinase, partial [Niameybacter sp.]
MRNIGYSKVVKLVLYICIALASIGGIYSLYGLARMPREKNYYSSYGYEYELISKAGYVRDWIVRYVDDKIFEKEGVTAENIKRYRNADKTVASDEQALAGIIADRRDYFEMIQDELVRRNVNVEYVAIDKANEKVITNSPLYTGKNLDTVIEDFLKSPTLIIGDGENIKRSIQEERIGNVAYTNYYQGNGVKNKDNYAVYVRTQDSLQPGDYFYEQATSFEKATVNKDLIYVWGIISFVIGLLDLMGWIKVVGQKEEGGAVHVTFFDKIPFEIQAVGSIFTIGIWFAMVVEWISHMTDIGWVPYMGGTTFRAEELVLWVLIISGVSFALLVLSSVIKHIKNNSLSQYIFVWRLGKWIKNDVINEKTLPFAAAGMIVGYIFIENLLLSGIKYSWGLLRLFSWLMFLSFNGLMLMILVKLVVDYVKLSRGVEALSKGNLKPEVKLTYSLPVMNRTASAINHIGEGLETAVEQSVKSERLKTELITNVSHDLKTPLTSIISYIDLLKEEEIDNKAATEYIGILDERSNRLKQLVEDLVEASKAATGNVKAEVVPMRLDQLVIQAVGEYTDRLEASQLEVVCSKVEEVNVLVDGRHMWRVIENLLSNVCKYAMPCTRVYIDVLKGEHVGCIVIKNISKEPL